MARKVVPVNFENDQELYTYVAQHNNKADFIRNCIRSHMEGQRIRIDYDEVENRVERVLKRHIVALQEVKQEVDEDVIEALNFFEFD